MTQPEIVQVIKLSADQSSADQAAQAMQKVRDQVVALNADLDQTTTVAQSVAEQLEAMGVSADDVFTRSGDKIDTGLTAPLENADEKAKSLVATIHDIGLQLNALPEPNLSAFGVDESGGGDGGISTGGLRSGLRAGGGLLGAQAGGGDVRAISQIVALTSSFGPAGAAAAGFALIMRESAAASEAAKNAEQARLTAEADVTTFIQTSTKEQKQQRLDALKDTYSTDLTLFAQTQQSLSSNRAQLPNPTDSSIINQLFASDFQGKAEADADSLHKLSTAMGQNQSDQELLRIAIEHGGETAADTAAKEQQIADFRKVQAELEQQRVNYQVAGAQAVLAADQMTAEQRKQQIDLDGRQVVLLRQQLEQQGLSQGAGDKIREQITGLIDQMGYLGKITDSYVDQLNEEAKAKQTLTDQTQSYLDLLTQEGKTEDAIAAQNAKITQLQDDAAAKEADALTQKNAKIADIEAQGADQREQIAQDNADAIAKIELEAGRSEFADKANRDAVAFTQAQQKEADDLANQKKTEEKQFTTLAANLAKQEKSVETSYKTQVAQVETSLSQQVATQRRGLLQLETDLLNEKNAELSISQVYGIGIQDAHVTMLQGIESAVLTYGVRIVSGLNSILSGFQPLPPPSNGGSQGAMTPDKVNAIVRNNLAGYIGLRQGG